MLDTATNENLLVRKMVIKSPLPGVSSEKWDVFVRIMSVQLIKDVSLAGGIGSFDLRPRRLGELEVMTNLHRNDRGVWVGDLLPKFALIRSSLGLQYKIFEDSMKKYDAALVSEEIVKPENVSKSGALA